MIYILVPSGLKFIPLIPGVSSSTSLVCTKVNSAKDFETNKTKKRIEKNCFFHNFMKKKIYNFLVNTKLLIQGLSPSLNFIESIIS